MFRTALSHLTLRQLRAFEAVARHASFTAAAEALHITQPTLSMQIKKLADAVGGPVFEQVGRRIHLTDLGEELLKTSREIRQSLERLDMAVAELQGVERGTLRLTGVTTSEYFAPRVLGAFRQRHPGIAVSLNVTNRAMVLQRLAENRDDLYIIGQPPEGDELVCEPFLDNPLVVLAAPDHPLARRPGIPLSELQGELFLLREPGSGTRNAVETYLRAQGLELDQIMELGSNEAIKQAAIAGMGIAVLSQYALAHEVAHGELAILDVEGFPLAHHWYVAYPRGKRFSVVARAFYDYLFEEGRRIARSALTDPLDAHHV